MTCLRAVWSAACLVALAVGCRSAPIEDVTVDWLETLERANAILAEAQDGASAALARDRLVALERGLMRSIRARADALGPGASGPVDAELRARLEDEQQRFAQGLDRLLGYGREVPDEVRVELQRLRPVFTRAE